MKEGLGYSIITLIVFAFVIATIFWSASEFVRVQKNMEPEIGVFKEYSTPYEGFSMKCEVTVILNGEEILFELDNYDQCVAYSELELGDEVTIIKGFPKSTRTFNDDTFDDFDPFDILLFQ